MIACAFRASGDRWVTPLTACWIGWVTPLTTSRVSWVGWIAPLTSCGIGWVTPLSAGRVCRISPLPGRVGWVAPLASSGVGRSGGSSRSGRIASLPKLIGIVREELVHVWIEAGLSRLRLSLPLPSGIGSLTTDDLVEGVPSGAARVLVSHDSL